MHAYQYWVMWNFSLPSPLIHVYLSAAFFFYHVFTIINPLLFFADVQQIFNSFTHSMHFVCTYYFAHGNSSYPWIRFPLWSLSLPEVSFNTGQFPKTFSLLFDLESHRYWPLHHSLPVPVSICISLKFEFTLLPFIWTNRCSLSHIHPFSHSDWTLLNTPKLSLPVF